MARHRDYARERDRTRDRGLFLARWAPACRNCGGDRERGGVVDHYQLMCGHWESKPPGYEIGDVFPGCTRCNTLREVVIGKAADFLAFTTTTGSGPLEVSQ